MLFGFVFFFDGINIRHLKNKLLNLTDISNISSSIYLLMVISLWIWSRNHSSQLKTMRSSIEELMDSAMCSGTSSSKESNVLRHKNKNININAFCEDLIHENLEKRR